VVEVTAAVEDGVVLEAVVASRPEVVEEVEEAVEVAGTMEGEVEEEAVDSIEAEVVEEVAAEALLELLPRSFGEKLSFFLTLSLSLADV
jgi:hypothetical protein